MNKENQQEREEISVEAQELIDRIREKLFRKEVLEILDSSEIPREVKEDIQNKVDKEISGFLENPKEITPSEVDFVVCPSGRKDIKRNCNVTEAEEPSKQRENQPRIEMVLELAIELDPEFDIKEHFCVSDDSEHKSSPYRAIEFPSYEVVIFAANEPDNATYICPTTEKENDWKYFAEMSRTELQLLADNYKEFQENNNKDLGIDIPPRVKRIRWRNTDTKESSWMERVESSLRLDEVSLPKPKFTNEALKNIPDETILKLAKESLIEAGFTDRFALETADFKGFIHSEFGDFGKGVSLCKIVLQKKIKRVKKELRKELADKVGFPEKNSPENIEEYKKVLADQGYIDRFYLETANIEEFSTSEFGRFGKGRFFVDYLLGEDEYIEHVSKDHLRELGDLIFGNCSREELARKILGEAGLNNREKLMSLRVVDFRRMKLANNKGPSVLYSWLFGRNVDTKEIKRGDIDEIADLLFPQE